MELVDALPMTATGKILKRELSWGGSFMSGSEAWTIIGSVVAGLGVALVIVGLQRRPHRQISRPVRFGRAGTG